MTFVTSFYHPVTTVRVVIISCVLSNCILVNRMTRLLITDIALGQIIIIYLTSCIVDTQPLALPDIILLHHHDWSRRPNPSTPRTATFDAALFPLPVVSVIIPALLQAILSHLNNQLLLLLSHHGLAASLLAVAALLGDIVISPDSVSLG